MTITNVHMDLCRNERYPTRMGYARRIDGDAGQRVVDSLADIAPELGHQVAAWGFAEIYAAPGWRHAIGN